MEENFYAAPEVNVVDVVNNGGDYELASRGSRLGAHFVEGLIFGGIGMFMAIIIPAVSRTADGGSSPIAGVFGFLALGLILALVIVNIVLLVKNGQTIGKKILGIRIARTGTGEKAGFGRIFALRGLVPGIIGVIPVVGSIFNITNILFIFGESRQCLHDKIADTVVVKC